MRTEVIDWKMFMSGQYRRPTKLQIVLEHVERNKAIYRVCGAVVVLMLAADVTAFADGGLDRKADALYHGKILGFGKWALIIKGGWTALHKTIQEDFEGAKKSFFQYLLVYLFLLAFPWAMKEMDGMFA